MRYPEHLYDPTRVAIARMLIEKEFEKLFHVSPVLADFDAHDDNAVMDFWNLLAALMESIELKSSFSSYVTAANYTWVRQSVSVIDIRPSSQLDQLKDVRDLKWHADITAKEVKAAIDTAGVIEQQTQIVDKFSDESQTAYPIIIRHVAGEPPTVMDGNRRVLRAVLHGQSTIDAWVAHVEPSETAKDFWVPVNDLFQLVKLFRAGNGFEKQAVRNSLEILLRASTVTKINYEARVKGPDEANALFDLPPSA